MTRLTLAALLACLIAACASHPPCMTGIEVAAGQQVGLGPYMETRVSWSTTGACSEDNLDR